MRTLRIVFAVVVLGLVCYYAFFTYSMNAVKNKLDQQAVGYMNATKWDWETFLVNSDGTETLISYCKNISQYDDADSLYQFSYELYAADKTTLLAVYTREDDEGFRTEKTDAYAAYEAVVEAPSAYDLLGTDSDDLDYSEKTDDQGRTTDEWYISKSGQLPGKHIHRILPNG